MIWVGRRRRAKFRRPKLDRSYQSQADRRRVWLDAACRTERKQERALAQKTIRVPRSGRAVEDALQREARQDLIEIDTLRLGEVEQARTDGAAIFA